MKKRGQVWWVRFDPSVGSEIQKTRPAVIVSSNDSNQVLDRFQVVPLTTTVKSDGQEAKPRSGEVIIPFKGNDNTAKVNQLTTVSIERFVNGDGSINKESMVKIDKELREQLSLNRKRITARKKNDG